MPFEPCRKIEFTGEALTLIEARAAERELPFKTAAAELIMQASKPVDPPQPDAIHSVADIVGAIHQLFDALVNRADSAILTNEYLDATVARAEAAEAKLANLRAALG